MWYLVATIVHLNIGDCTQSINKTDTTYRKIVDIVAEQNEIFYIYQLANTSNDINRHLFNLEKIEEFEKKNKKTKCPKWFE